MALIPYILTLALIIMIICAIRAGISFRRIQARPVGFLSNLEQLEILTSKHIRRVLKGSTPSTIYVETRFKYPNGKVISVEASVIDGNLFLSELEGQRALDLWSKKGNTADYPPNLLMILQGSGCVVVNGSIQYGPVPFTPKALVDGVKYLASASLGVFGIPQPKSASLVPQG